MEALSLVHGEPTGTTSLFASLWKKGLILSKKEREREKGLIVSPTTKWNYGLFFFSETLTFMTLGSGGGFIFFLNQLNSISVYVIDARSN